MIVCMRLKYRTRFSVTASASTAYTALDKTHATAGLGSMTTERTIISLDDHRSLELIEKAQRKRDEKFGRLYRESQAMVAEEANVSGQVGFLSSTMVQVTLPHREPKGSPAAWGRSNGRASLTIQPGFYMAKETQVDLRGRKKVVSRPVSIGYPYGSIPRLLLAWVGREVARKKSREIVLGSTLTQFMNDLGISSHTGGVRGSITAVKEQTKRLFSSTIALVDNPDQVDWSNDGFKLADSLNVWWDPSCPEQSGLFDSKVTLSERFFEEILRSPVPLDMRALRALKQSTFALDVYCWLTYRSFSVSRRTEVPWEALQAQFGSETQSVRKFRSLFRRALNDVAVVYPDAKYDASSSAALVLLPGGRTSVRQISR